MAGTHTLHVEYATGQTISSVLAWEQTVHTLTEGTVTFVAVCTRRASLFFNRTVRFPYQCWQLTPNDSLYQNICANLCNSAKCSFYTYFLLHFLDHIRKHLQQNPTNKIKTLLRFRDVDVYPLTFSLWVLFFFRICKLYIFCWHWASCILTVSVI